MRVKILPFEKLAVVLVLTVAAVGCSGNPSSETVSAKSDAPAQVASENATVDPDPEVLRRQAQEVAEREAEVAAREAAVAARESKARAAQKAPRATAPEVLETRSEVETPTATAGIAVEIPSLTAFDIEFPETLSSETSVSGERFSARVVNDVMAEGHVAIPAGSWVGGTVTEVRSSKKIGGQSKLSLAFDNLRLPSGDEAPLFAVLHEAGKSQTKKDAATIGGAAAGGVLLGKVLNKGKTAKGEIVGGLLGAAIGTAIAAKNPGDPVELGPGMIVALQLDQPVHVVIREGIPHFTQYANNQ